MSSHEFSMWFEFLAEEPTPPAEGMFQAQLLAAVCGGPVRKRSGGMLSVEDFWRRPWAPRAPAKPTAPTAQELRSQVAAMWFGKGA